MLEDYGDINPLEYLKSSMQKFFNYPIIWTKSSLKNQTKKVSLNLLVSILNAVESNCSNADTILKSTDLESALLE